MIEAGRYICPYCGNIMSRAFYKGRDMATGALLTRKKGGYALIPCVAGSHDISEADPVEFSIVNPDQLGNGLPDSIRASYKMKDENVTHQIIMNRCCPECSDVHEFSPRYGTIPTYVIAVVGGRYAGKTVWRGSIAAVEHSAHLNSGDFPWQIDPDNLMTTSQIVSQTEATGEGNTTVLYLRKKGAVQRGAAPEYYASVLLRDFSGELFKNPSERKSISQEDETPLHDLLNIPDAYLFVADETTPDGQAYSNVAYNIIRKRIMSRQPRPLIGMILSHADVWMEKKPQKEISAETNYKIPALTPDTFRLDDDGSYTMRAFLPRVELEDMISREISPLAKDSRATGWVQKCFLVKSVDPTLNDKDSVKSDKEKENLYQNGINVYDPLIWLLNQIGIFPLE